MPAYNPKRMEERSTAEVVLVFMILPIPIGIAILTFAVVNVVANGHQFTVADWFFQVGWFGLLGLGIMTALPAAGWQELRKRRQGAPPEYDKNEEVSVMPRNDESHRTEPNSDEAPVEAPDFPRYVRLLAVAYVLSQLVGPAGFLLLSGLAGFLWLRRGLSVDGLVLGMWLAALGCPLCCAAFRWWFRSWGRRRWPPDEPVDGS